MRKESLEELTNYGQIMDLVTDSPNCLLKSNVSLIKKFDCNEMYINNYKGGGDPNLQIQSILFKSFSLNTSFIQMLWYKQFDPNDSIQAISSE